MDKLFMSLALAEARKAIEFDEVPVGAVLVKDNVLIASAHNKRETNKNALAHAEMLVIQRACEALGSWRLSGTTLYVTLEPCPMCAGAMVQARIDRCVFGAADTKSGAAGSVCDLLRHPVLNHRLVVEGGLMQEESAELLKKFFVGKRAGKA